MLLLREEVERDRAPPRAEVLRRAELLLPRELAEREPALRDEPAALNRLRDPVERPLAERDDVERTPLRAEAVRRAEVVLPRELALLRRAVLFLLVDVKRDPSMFSSSPR